MCVLFCFGYMYKYISLYSLFVFVSPLFWIHVTLEYFIATHVAMHYVKILVKKARPTLSILILCGTQSCQCVCVLRTMQQ